MKKILFVTANGVGLGHIRRSSLIAEAILKEIKVNILFATMCKKVKFLQNLDIPYLRLKCLSDEILDNPDKFKKAKLYNNDMYSSIIVNYKPDLVVLDIHIILKSTYYDFIFDEKYRGIKKVFIFRINDSDNFIETVYKNKKLDEFTKVLLPHDKKELKYVLKDNDIEYIKKSSKFRVVGPIIGEAKSGVYLRKKYNINKEDFLITFSAGGGGSFKKGGCESALTRVEDFLDNYEKIKTKISNLRTIIILGPLFREDIFKKYLKVIKENKIYIIEFEENIINLFRESNLLITTTGYNTANEIQSNGIPAILMPIKRGDDQFLRAKYLRGKGIINIYDKQKNNFFDIIIKTYNDLEIMKNSFKDISFKSGNRVAAKEIIDIIKF